MHSVLTADLAALVSQHGPAILYHRDAIPPPAMGQYWAASRSRFELWHQAMNRYRKTEKKGDYGQLRAWWRDHRVILEEVFVTEMLTRVIAALAARLDDEHETEEISPVSHAIYMSHLEARNRVQHIMLYGKGCSVQDIVQLNRLRQGVERWTDAMIGRLSVSDPTKIQYAIDTTRAARYAEESRGYCNSIARNTAIWLMNAAMHDTLRRRTSEQSALPHANRAVAQSVLMMLRPEMFDSVGLLKSLWMHRLEAGTERTDRVVHELQSPDIHEAATASAIETTQHSYFQRWYM